ncbi:MAG: amidase [Actinomycetales bacterium]|nr:MAG: amidase [Actinomycetales bacterium]
MTDLTRSATDSTPGPVPTARQIAADVRAGHLSARAAVEHALARITAYDQDLGAFTVVRAERALAEADAIDAGWMGHDGPLAGVPVAVKEEYDVAGEVTTLGGFGNSTPAENDSEVIRRLRAAGAVIVGKTSMPEFGQFPQSDSARYGRTYNPWDSRRSAGGSCSGSAAAVAAGLVPVGMGSDGAGSIRVPASCCGLVGLKPQRGRISSAPLTEFWHGLVSLGALTRTVADQALVLDVISGNMPTDRWRAEPPVAPFVEQAAQSPRAARSRKARGDGLRIGWTTKTVMPGRRVDPQVAEALAATARALADLGHQVTRIAPPWPAPTAAFMPLFYSGMREEARLVEHPELLDRTTRQTLRLAGWATPAVVRQVQRIGRRVAAAVDAGFAHWDVLLLPTLDMLPPPAGQFVGLGTLRAQLRATPILGNTAIANVTGHPALSVPIGLSREGWPIGGQLLGATGQEGLLLALAAQLEQAQPWPGLAPAYR